MAQISQDRVAGSAEPTTAPATLTLADILQALARLSLQATTDGQPTPPPLSVPLEPASATAKSADEVHNEQEPKAKASIVDNDRYPCAECTARGCLPAPLAEDNESASPPAAALVSQASDTASPRWYVITAGRRVGVFSHWANVAPHVLRVSGAVFVKYPTRSAAEATFTAATNIGDVRILE